jgi:hypothetical protein
MSDFQREDWEKERTRAHDDANKAFQSGTFWTDDDERLKRYIFGTAAGSIKNTELYATEIVRCLAINHIQMSRVIERMNRQNDVLSRRVYWLTWVATLAGIAQVVAAYLALK